MQRTQINDIEFVKQYLKNIRILMEQNIKCGIINSEWKQLLYISLVEKGDKTKNVQIVVYMSGSQTDIRITSC
ncbi:unnamed protein product [Paramecium sonneborni]|uniref:Uncharacterized protein n=1 Tax=Paramecium sonneborni TaxID=65129 RepID=A0A8S1R9Z1_9CILI|nr:unnamed protein product [Paramecium sonneborni]